MRISDWSSDVCSSDLHEADGDPGEHHERVAEDRLACEHRDDLRHDAEAGQHEDVDLRVAEDPDEVLPQQRIGALGHVEEVGVAEAVDGEKEQRYRADRQREATQTLGYPRHPRSEVRSGGDEWVSTG